MGTWPRFHSCWFLSWDLRVCSTHSLDLRRVSETSVSPCSSGHRAGFTPGRCTTCLQVGPATFRGAWAVLNSTAGLEKASAASLWNTGLLRAPSPIPHIPSEYSQSMSRAGIKTTYKSTHSLLVDQDCAREFQTSQGFTEQGSLHPSLGGG